MNLMPQAQIISIVSNFAASSIFAAIGWLYIDALLLRFELRSALKCLAFTLLTIAFAQNFAAELFKINSPVPSFWIQSIALYLMFGAFIADTHSRLQILTIFAIALLFFFKNHALLAIQALMIALAILQLAYNTKHKDLIPLVTGFILMSTGEFFYYLNNIKGFENISQAGNFLYIFASIALFYWLWSYLAIRFAVKNFNFPKKI